MTPALLLRETAGRFRAAGIPDPETDGALLLSFLTGHPPLVLRLDTESDLPPALLNRFRELVERRLSREPLQYLTGEAYFLGRSFHVDSRVLIPRPETEELCRWVLDCIPDGAYASVLDLCCGSGCIGLSLAAERPSFRVTLSDLSADALAVSALNADRLQVSVSLRQGNLCAGLPRAAFDCIVSNPPYIPSDECARLQPEVLYEPRMALDGGADGLGFYRRIAAETLPLLVPGGHLFLEIGYGEAADVSAVLASAGFSGIAVRDDFAGIPRMIHALSARTEDVCSRS